MDPLVAVRALIEGRRADSVRALANAAKAMADPEVIDCAAGHCAHLDQPALALKMLAQSVGVGDFANASVTEEPWFEPLVTKPEFQRLLNQMREGHESALAAFGSAGGPDLLG